METPKEIEKQLERLVGSTIGVVDVCELCREVDKTCKVINRYFAKHKGLKNG